MNEPSVRCVLVVEDDDLVRRFLVRILEVAGYEATEARSGEEALRSIREGRGVVAVLVDGLLPDLHGFALARRLIEGPAGDLLPLCFVTGALTVPCPATSGIAVLPKPVRGGAVIEELGRLARWRAAGGSPVGERLAVLAKLEAGLLVAPPGHEGGNRRGI